mgnify:FL=1|tara:strand:+ start:702 stop:932 length:231 start_codon:yes stop_codon:yes gene_type:complete
MVDNTTRTCYIIRVREVIMNIDIKTKKELNKSLRILEERIAFAKKEFFTGLKQKSLYAVISKNLIDNQLMGGYNAN